MAAANAHAAGDRPIDLVRRGVRPLGRRPPFPIFIEESEWRKKNLVTLGRPGRCRRPPPAFSGSIDFPRPVRKLFPVTFLYARWKMCQWRLLSGLGVVKF